MINEDFYIDTTAQHLFVIIRDKDPTSYFFFPIEFTLPKLIRFKDIEPARLIKKQIRDIEYEFVLTRVHYWCLIVWINPKRYPNVIDGKPVIGFGWNFHMPYLFKDGDPILQRFDIQGGKVLNHKEKIFLAGATADVGPEEMWSSEEPQPYPGIALEVKEGILRNDQSFDNFSIMKNSAIVILVGNCEEVNTVTEWLIGTKSCVSRFDIQKLLD